MSFHVSRSRIHERRLLRGSKRASGVLVCAVAALGLVGSACSSSAKSTSSGTGSSTTAASGTPFRFAFDSGVSGAFASVASLEMQGMKAAIAQLNSQGGILGHPVELVPLDSQGDPTTAVSVLQQYLSGGNKLNAVLSGITSQEASAMLPVLTRDGIASISAANDPALNNPSSYPYHFGIAPSAKSTLQTLVPLLKQMNAKTIAILVPNDAFGLGESSALQSALAGSGIQSNVTTFSDSAVDLTVPYESALQHKPDAVFLDAEGNSSAIFSARLKVGATSIPTFGGPALTGAPVTTIASAASLVNVKVPILSGLIKGGTPSPALSALLGANTYSGNTLAFVPALGFDAVKVIAFGATKAKSIEASAIAKALESSAPPAGYLVTEPAGLGYSSTNHFPPGAYTWIPATSSVSGGLWVTS